jgi:hypothetical protein
VMAAVRIGSLVDAEEHEAGSTVTAIACVVLSSVSRNLKREPFALGGSTTPAGGSRSSSACLSSGPIFWRRCW